MTLKRDVPYDLVYYLRENQADFPGVSVDRVYVRRYPQGDLARAHVRLRARGQRRAARRSPSTSRSRPATRSARPGSSTPYDNLLRGDQRRHPGPGGRDRARPPAAASASAGAARGQQPAPHARLRGSRRPARRRSSSFGLPGGFVAMDVDTGEILALGSAPSFDPSVFAQPVDPAGRSDEHLRARADTERADLQPRDPGRLSDRLDLQADHRDRAPSRRA